MFKAIKHAIYLYIHNKGWCQHLHRDKKELESWQHPCPFGTRVFLDLFPPRVVNSEEFERIGKITRGKGLRPGEIIRGDI